MKGIILAAGLGTRLKPLTSSRAKPALPVVGVPALWFGAWHLSKSLGLRELAMNLSHAPDTVRAAGDDNALRAFADISFRYSDETGGILGSSGALWKLKDWIGADQAAVCNGDAICFPSWQRLLEFHRTRGALLTLHVREFSGGAEPYRHLDVAADGRVAALADKRPRGVMFSGSYVIEPALLERLPAGASELKETLLEPLVAEKKLFAFREDVPWLDIGTPASYAEAQFDLLRRMPEARPLVEAKMREVSPGCWVPRDWKQGMSPTLNAPVVMTGAQKEWAEMAGIVGPRFAGIEPPPPGVEFPRNHALVCWTHIEKLSLSSRG